MHGFYGLFRLVALSESSMFKALSGESSRCLVVTSTGVVGVLGGITVGVSCAGRQTERDLGRCGFGVETED